MHVDPMLMQAHDVCHVVEQRARTQPLCLGAIRFAALSTLVLVPTDVATTLEDESVGLLWLWWRIVYW